MMYSWDLIRVFLALHRCGSYEAAAQLLGVDVSTTRRKLQTLEASTGTPLFVRRDGQFTLAPDREILLQAALQMEAASLMFSRQAEGGQQGGTVRISTLDILAGLVAPQIGAFQQTHPHILIDMTTEPHFVDLEREMIDIAIRLARPTRGGDGLKKLSTVGFSVYGAASYFERYGAAVAPGHNILSLSANFAHQDHEFELADEEWFKVQHRIGNVVSCADSYTIMLKLCESGLGLAMLPDFLAEASPNLHRFGGAEFRMEVDLWIVIRKDLAKMPKIRATVSFLSEHFRRLSPMLLVRAPAPMQAVG
jgi:DNA-binding transcriptional LysR family regulator